jgi:hypothetical protein
LGGRNDTKLPRSHEPNATVCRVRARNNLIKLSLSSVTTSVAIQIEDPRKLDDPLVIDSGTGGGDKTFPMHADHNV